MSAARLWPKTNEKDLTITIDSILPKRFASLVVGRRSWWPAFRTARTATLAQPGSLAPKDSRWIGMRLHYLEMLLAVGLSGLATLLLLLGAAVPTVSPFLPFGLGSIATLFVLTLISCEVGVPLIYSTPRPAWGGQVVVLCKPDKFILRMFIPAQRDGTGILRIRAKDFLAVRRGEGAATEDIVDLLTEVVRRGSITVEGKAQNEELAVSYYGDKLGFSIIGRRIVLGEVDERTLQSSIEPM